MANKIITPQLIANFVLEHLLGSLVYRDLVYKAELSNQIASAKAGDTVNVKRPSVFKMKRYGGSLIEQNLNETSIPVTLDIIGDITVPISSKEMTLEVNDFQNQVLAPIGRGLAVGIDQYVSGKIFQSIDEDNIIKGTESPTNLKDVVDLGVKLDLAKAPKDGRSLIVSPTHKARYALTDNLSKVNYAGSSVTLRDALLGKVYGFNTLESSYNPVGTGGGTTTAVGKITVSGTPGAKTLALANVTPATGTIKAGDLIIIDGKPILVTDDATATSGAIADLKVDQEDVDDLLNGVYVTGTPGANETKIDISLSTKDVSLGFSDIAFGLVNVPLDNPLNNVSSAIAEYEGISVRVFYGYDQGLKTQKLSVDTLFGFASFYPEAAGAIVG